MSRQSTPSDSVTTRWIPDADPYRPRFEELSKDLQIVETARRQAVSNLPLTTDKDLDELQSRILAAGDHGTGVLVAFAKNEIAKAQADIDRLKPTAFNAALEQADIARAIADEKQQAKDQLDETHRKRQRAWREREVFKIDNGLSRSATYSRDITLFVVTMLALAVVEAAANMFIFQDATDGGLTGGFMLAIGIGAVNIGIGWCTGFFGRRILHIDRRKRADGWIVIGFGAMAVFALNLVVAHFRESIETLSPGASPSVDFSIILRPTEWFGFTSILPFILFAAGILFSVVAVMKGSGGRGSPNDRYPGFASIDRVFAEADEKLAESREAFKIKIRHAYDAQRLRLRERHCIDEENLTQIRNIGAHASRLAHDVQASNIAWLDVTTTLLKRYRHENLKIRTTPPPVYFFNYPNFEELRTRLVGDDAIRAGVNECQRIFDGNVAELAALEEKLAHEQTVEIEKFLDYIKESERRAENQIVREDIARDVDFTSGLAPEAPHG
jgi:multisubunit Na+/H+ antiporter MnhB subunit